MAQDQTALDNELTQVETDTKAEIAAVVAAIQAKAPGVDFTPEITRLQAISAALETETSAATPVTAPATTPTS